MPKAARFYKVGEPLKLEEVSIPKPGLNDVLIKVKAASMCYSDIHAITGNVVANPPVTLGHEIAGEIVEMGSEVIDIKKGQKAVVHFVTPCHDCKFCLQGKSSVCKNLNSNPMYGFSVDGGFAEYVKVKAGNIVILPEGVPYEFGATLGCAGITALHAVRSVADVGIGDTVAVYGTGGVGMYVLQLARICGAAKTIAIGRSEEKLKMAVEKFGADAAVNVSKEKLTDSIKRETAGRGVDAMFDFVANSKSIDDSTKVLANLGKLVLVGIGSEPVAVNPRRLTFKEAAIVGSNVGTKDELQQLVNLADSKRLKGVANARYPLGEINTVVSEFKAGRIAGRAFFDPSIQ